MQDYEIFIKNIINTFKSNYFENPEKYSIPIIHNGEKIGRLRPIPTEIKGDAVNDVTLQTKWRNLHKDTFFVEPFIATEERTLNWLKETYFTNADRIIFMIEAIDNKPIGHLGFENFDYNKRMCEYGRLMRGDFSSTENQKKVNLIEQAQISLLDWGFNTLKVDIIYGTLFEDNYLVRRLHDKCGFITVAEFSVKKGNGTKNVLKIELTRNKYNSLFKNK